jgi:hypothetical protein
LLGLCVNFTHCPNFYAALNSAATLARTIDDAVTEDENNQLASIAPARLDAVQ